MQPQAHLCLAPKLHLRLNLCVQAKLELSSAPIMHPPGEQETLVPV